MKKLEQRSSGSVRGFLTVSTNTEVDFLVERIGLEGFGDTKNGILKKKKKKPRCQELHRFDGAN